MNSYYYIKCRDTGLIMISSEELLNRSEVHRVIENYFGYGKTIESCEREHSFFSRHPMPVHIILVKGEK